MDLPDLAGLLGVLLMLLAYAGAQFQRLDPRRAPALGMNFIGSGLVLYSLSVRFNLAAFVMETAWGLVAFHGLVRLGLERWRRRSD